jgi:hypothetical protein
MTSQDCTQGYIEAHNALTIIFSAELLASRRSEHEHMIEIRMSNERSDQESSWPKTFHSHMVLSNIRPLVHLNFGSISILVRRRDSASLAIAGAGHPLAFEDVLSIVLSRMMSHTRQLLQRALLYIRSRDKTIHIIIEAIWIFSMNRLISNQQCLFRHPQRHSTDVLDKEHDQGRPDQVPPNDEQGT